MNTKADKILALAKVGYLRKEVAGIVGISYQRAHHGLKRSGMLRDVVIEREPLVQQIALEEETAHRPAGAAYLLDCGFRPSGEWHAPDAAGIAMTAPAPRETSVYSFVLDGPIVYVGLTLTGLHMRLGSYRRGYQRQRSSFRVTTAGQDCPGRDLR